MLASTTVFNNKVKETEANQDFYSVTFTLFISQLLYLMISILADQTPNLQTAQTVSDHFTF